MSPPSDGHKPPNVFAPTISSSPKCGGVINGGWGALVQQGAGGVSLSIPPVLPPGQEPDTHSASLVFSELYLRLTVPFGNRADLAISQRWADPTLQLLLGNPLTWLVSLWSRSQMQKEPAPRACHPSASLQWWQHVPPP